MSARGREPTVTHSWRAKNSGPQEWDDYSWWRHRQQEMAAAEIACIVGHVERGEVAGLYVPDLTVEEDEPEEEPVTGFAGFRLRPEIAAALEDFKRREQRA